MSIQSLLSRKPIGLILRTFATEEDQIEKRVTQVRETVETALAVSVEGREAFRRVDVLVWADERYGERSDCGKTAPVLRREFDKTERVFVSEVTRGDLFCGLLNYGVVHQMRHGMDYSVILSPDARSYLDAATMKRALEAIGDGAKAVGVAIKELRTSVLEGRLTSTFCLWDGNALLQVGGFDDRAAMPVDERLAKYMRGWSPELREHVFYSLAGVEEMFPLARLVDTFGPCLAPILPANGGAYEIPDPKTQRAAWKRHVAKMGTKLERQSMHLASMSLGLSYLKGGVMERYRDPEIFAELL